MLIISNVQEEGLKPWDEPRRGSNDTELLGDQIAWVPTMTADLIEELAKTTPHWDERRSLSMSTSPSPDPEPAATNNAMLVDSLVSPMSTIETVDGHDARIPELDLEDLHPSDILFRITHDYIRNIYFLQKTEYKDQPDKLFSDEDVRSARDCLEALGYPERFLEGAWDGEASEEVYKRHELRRQQEAEDLRQRQVADDEGQDLIMIDD